MKKLLWLNSILVLAAGCASQPTSNETSSKDKVIVKNTVYVKGLEEVSLEHQKNAKCSSPKEGVMSMSWNDQVALMNACVQANDWSRLEGIAKSHTQQLPQSPWGPYFLSLNAEQRGDTDQSRWFLSLAEKRGGNQLPVFLVQSARLDLKSGLTKSAVERLQKAVEIRPSLTDAQQYLGVLFYKEGNYKLAKAHLQKAMQGSGLTRDVYLAYGHSLNELGEAQSAANAYEKGLSYFETDGELLSLLAETYETKLRDLPGALRTYEKLDTLSRKGKLRSDIAINFKEKIQQLTKEVEKVKAKKEDTPKDSKDARGVASGEKK